MIIRLCRRTVSPLVDVAVRSTSERCTAVDADIHLHHDSPRYSLAAAFLPDITAVNVRLARHIQRDNAYLAVYSGPPRARRPVLSCAPGAVPSVRPSVFPRGQALRRRPRPCHVQLR